MASVEAAEKAALAHGLVLDWDDVGWPAMGWRIASLRVLKGGRVVARAAQTYRDEAGKKRALSFCANVVFHRPD